MTVDLELVDSLLDFPRLKGVLVEKVVQVAALENTDPVSLFQL